MSYSIYKFTEKAAATAPFDYNNGIMYYYEPITVCTVFTAVLDDGGTTAGWWVPALLNIALTSPESCLISIRV